MIVQTGKEYQPRMVRTGISSLDQTEVLEGLAENEQVVYTFFSRAKQAGEEMRQRMTNMDRQRSGFRN